MAAWSAADIPDLTGRTALVTGANSGIGHHVAVRLAAHGCRVLLAVRDPGRGEQAVRRLTALAPEAAAETVRLDLADLSSVREAAEEVRRRTGGLDLLVNNAGVMGVPQRLTTTQGFELQFGTNHLGHFALTGLLLPLLLDRTGSRIVVVSSLAHRHGRLDFADLQWERRRYSAWGAYGASKLANAVFAAELGRRLAAAGAATAVLGAHPGVSATSLGSSGPRLGGGSPWSAIFYQWGIRLIGQSAERGALPVLRAATDPAAVGGEYYGPTGPGEWRGAPGPVAYRASVRDTAQGRALWEASEQLTGVAFPLPAPA